MLSEVAAVGAEGQAVDGAQAGIATEGAAAINSPMGNSLMFVEIGPAGEAGPGRRRWERDRD